MRERFRALIRTYQELIVWMPPAVVLMVAAYYIIPHVDPTSGVDGFGQVYAMLVNVVGGIIVCFSAWLTKRSYLGLVEPVHRHDVSLKVLLVDLGEWSLCFVFWFWVVFRS